MSNPYKRNAKKLAPAFIIASLASVTVMSPASASVLSVNPFQLVQSVNPFQLDKAMEEDLPVGQGSGFHQVSILGGGFTNPAPIVPNIGEDELPVGSGGFSNPAPISLPVNFKK